MHYPRIVFVDAPTAVGKDYFIERFVKALGDINSELKVTVLRATDIIFNEDTKTEDRKYTEYRTESEKTKAIFKGHLQLATTIFEKLTSMTDRSDVVVVNRSFLSFLIYNINPVIRANLNDARRALLIAEYTSMTKSYVEFYKKLFTYYPTLFVGLELRTADNKTVDEVLANRIQARNDGKPVARAWLRQIYRDYEQPDSTLMEIFTYKERVTSNDYVDIAMQYYSDAHA